jgi:hypothetical protein
MMLTLGVRRALSHYMLPVNSSCPWILMRSPETRAQGLSDNSRRDQPALTLDANFAVHELSSGE